MPSKARTPAPIDRPLSKAYLREFTGWATAYAPGLSDPTSLRIMENCWITREGALAIRPALRSVFPENNWINTNFNAAIIGSFETFFLNDGSKALLFATKEANGTIMFRVARYDEASAQYEIITLADAGFDGSTTFSSSTTYVRYLQIDNKIFALADSTNPADTARIFYVGEDKRVIAPREIGVPEWHPDHAPLVRLPPAEWINNTAPGARDTWPQNSTRNAGTAGQPLTGTLISSNAEDNTFNFGYFYTFENELGETAPSQMTVVKTKRGWSQWQFQTAAEPDGGPSGTNISDPSLACDQLVAVMRDDAGPGGPWSIALAHGATRWNLYMVTWSDQGSVPVEGTLVGSREITSDHQLSRWIQHTPVAESYDVTMALPNENDRTNYSSPSSASQGIVAGDRIRPSKVSFSMVLPPAPVA